MAVAFSSTRTIYRAKLLFIQKTLRNNFFDFFFLSFFLFFWSVEGDRGKGIVAIAPNCVQLATTATNRDPFLDDFIISFRRLLNGKIIIISTKLGENRADDYYCAIWALFDDCITRDAKFHFFFFCSLFVPTIEMIELVYLFCDIKHFL